MKNNGLLKFILVLAFCGVLSMYALTEGSIERLDVDASEVTHVSYVMAGEEYDGVEITDEEYIGQIVAEMNSLELRKANFKIKRAELDEMTGIMILKGDIFLGEKPDFVSLWFLPDNRVMAAWDEKEGLYTADYEQLDKLAEQFARETIQKDPYATAAIMFGIHESMLE